MKVVWKSHNIIDDQMKKETLVTTLQECVITWYIRYYTDNLTAALVDI